MALGDEAAVLSIEVDDEDAFEELGDESEDAAERTDVAWRRVSGNVTRYWKGFFEFLKTGSDETRARIEGIEAAAESMKSSLADATAQSGPVSALLSTMEEVLSVSKQLPGTFSALGEIIGSIAVGPLGMMLRMARDIRNVAQGGVPGGEQIAAGILSRVNAQVAASVGAAQAQAAVEGSFRTLAGQIGSSQVSRNAQAIAGTRARGGGGGGGGLAPSDMTFSEEEAAEIDRQAQRVLDIVKDTWSQIDDANREHYARQREQAELATDARIAYANRVKDAELAALEVTTRAKRDALEEDRRTQQELSANVQGYTRALIELTTASLQQGATVTQVLQAVLSATLQEISGKAAAQAAYYFALGLGLEATTMGVPNPGSTAAFASAAGFAAIAVGAGLGAAAVAPTFGGGRGGGTSRRAGGGGSFAPPREGAADGGGGPLHVTLVLNAAGEVADDSSLRRLGKSLDEIMRRGYARGYRSS